MNLRYLLLISSLLTACMFPSLSSAQYPTAERLKAQCDRDNAFDCFSLGLMYEDGRGVEQDLFEAEKLFRKACDKGLARGCSSLGWMYETGTGVTQDLFQATEFYRKACAGGTAIP
ncbi:MAG: sel1 repeat family protein, partial [Nitrospira sp.]|nr:sel1 repeat family protein [Nitrospira sp.]